jgi:hypothetical protein
MTRTVKKCRCRWHLQATAGLVLPCLLLCLLAISQAGCVVAAVGVAAGAGAYGYYQGNYTSTCPAEFGETYQAAKLALADLAMPVRQESHQGTTGEIESSIADGSHVTISMEEKPRMTASDGHQTEVTIRVGYFGDEKLSKEIQEKITLHINQRAPQQPNPSRLPPIGGAQPVVPGQVVTPPPGVTTPPPAGVTAPPAVTPTNPGWKPATPVGTKVPPP